MAKSDARDEAWQRQHVMLDWGLLDPGQSTEFAHNEYVRAMREPFTPLERQQIRAALGLGPASTGDSSNG